MYSQLIIHQTYLTVQQQDLALRQWREVIPALHAHRLLFQKQDAEERPPPKHFFKELLQNCTHACSHLCFLQYSLNVELYPT